MAASSPKSITAKITAPTLLGGGQSDSLFPLQQVNANAQQIMQANPKTPVKVIWHGQGHDGGIDESERLLEKLPSGSIPIWLGRRRQRPRRILKCRSFKVRHFATGARAPSKC